MAQVTRPAGRRTPLAAAGLFVFWLAVYLSTVSPTVNFIDSGELITALYEPGIAHPPGYPLYVLLGYVVSHLLPGEVAWRVNAISALGGALAVTLLFLLLVEVAAYARQVAERRARLSERPAKKPRRGAAVESDSPPPGDLSGISWSVLFLAAAGASLFATSSSFWSRTAQAKMYTLHYAFVVFFLLAALKCRAAYERGDERLAVRWLVATAFGFGLSLTNHLMTILLLPGLSVLLVGGAGWLPRFSTYVRRWYLIVPAGLAPLLLYLYLPLRAAQAPVMNWGAPTTWPDFYRHISGWQYRVYLFADTGENLGRVFNYLLQQWWVLTPLVLALAAAGAYLLARRLPVLFAAIVVTAALTFLFALAYGISEIEPYMVPFYAMLTIMLAGGGLAWSTRTEARGVGQNGKQRTSTSEQWLPAGTAALALIAAVSLVVQYPRQNHRDDRLAEQFVLNVFAELPQNSILITDYWDFYAPTYYLQQVRGVRPDVAIVDKSLLRYPWYLEQLARRHPFLIEKSGDVARQFAAEQSKWVNDQPFDSALLNNLYLGLLTSFVERNTDTHEAFLLMFPPCHAVPAPAQCESNSIAPSYGRQVNGLTTRLLKPGANPVVPSEPNYSLAGILGNQVPMDEFARMNSQLYADAYRRLAQVYQAVGDEERGARVSQKAEEIERALGGQ